ncbi:MAG: ABC transporter substrate-binding protein [Treponema sp.]|nr:ABC transporter substrate-binding protein [Treponema sp.]
MKKLSKIVLAGTLISLLAFFAGCSKKEAAAPSSGTSNVDYASVELGKTGTDINTTIKLMTHRTDMLQDTYSGVTFAKYLAEFNKVYPNIKVEIEGITDYASTALLRLQGGDWGDIMMIPDVDKKELKNYFLSFGKLATMEKLIKFPTNWEYDGQVYGIPSTGNAQGVLYNKKVFKDAGISKLPKTPDEFIADLKLIKEKTNAIPLYTNYAAGWTMGAWDAYLGGSATGDANYMNNVLLHTKDPFKNYEDGTHAYAVYKVLYDAAANGLIEDDYTTTDWEGCKGMINRGEIGTMVLGSWAFTQMQGAGPNPDDIGYMSFPITVNGKQYASAGPDYCFGVNTKASDANKMAAVIFIKWFTEKSGFAYNEGGIPISANDNEYPAAYAAFSENNVDFVADAPAAAGESDLFNDLNSESELNINAGGNLKVQEIIEHAANGTKSFDDIMASWNEAWSNAQTSEAVEIKY